MKILIIGLNIGQIYLKYFKEQEYQVDTLDIDQTKNPTFTDSSQITIKYDIIIICTPNYLHDFYIEELWNYGNYFIIDKPGLSTSDKWKSYLDKAKLDDKKIFMVKNNLYRKELQKLKEMIPLGVNKVEIIWQSNNRIPFPGGWFTNKSKSWGGVSRDILPHLLSYFYSLTEVTPDPIYSNKCQQYSINDITDTEYGTINYDNPVYDVDDNVHLEFKVNNVDYVLNSKWKSNVGYDRLYLKLYFESGSQIKYTFGFCPESVYIDMVEDYITGEQISYEEHNEIDLWMHKIMESI